MVSPSRLGDGPRSYYRHALPYQLAVELAPDLGSANAIPLLRTTSVVAPGQSVPAEGP